MIETIVTWASLFVVLALTHFVSDWLFQTNWEAKNKAFSPGIRALHCGIYTAFFIPVILLLSPSPLVGGSVLFVLWASHFGIDSYAPIYLWGRYVRRIPELRRNDVATGFRVDFPKLFKEHSIYAIIFITVDQILHLLFIALVALMLL